MSKAPAKPAAKPTAGKKGAEGKGKGKKGLFIPFLILALCGVFVLPLTIVAIAGMVPTLVMAITDKSRARSMTISVGAMNITGVVYLVVQVLQHGITLDYAIQLLQQPIHWLIMWGGAGIGVALLTLIPPVVAQVLTLLSEMKIQKLRSNQAEIRKTWGEDVKNA